MREIKLAEAEVKALCHYAKSKALDLAEACTNSAWARPDQVAPEKQWRRDGAAAPGARMERDAKIERDDLAGPLEVFGVLASSQLAFADGAGWPAPAEAIEIAFSPLACTWLADGRREITAGLDQRRATVGISGNTRNETFVLFVLDGIVEQLGGARDRPPDVKAAA